MRNETLRFLSLFGDGKEHSFFEICKLSVVMLRKSERKVAEMFKRQLLDNGWVNRLHKSPFEYLDFYILSDKGDECLRAENLRRLSYHNFTDAAKRHFKYFDRDSTKGKLGVKNLGDNVSETEARQSPNYKLPSPDIIESSHGC